MKKHYRGFVTVIAIGLVSLSMACSSDSPDSVSEEICNKEIECGYIADDEYDECYDDVLQFAQSYEEHSDDCWDAALDAHDCSLGLSCEDYLDYQANEDECGHAYDAFYQHCAGVFDY